MSRPSKNFAGDQERRSRAERFKKLRERLAVARRRRISKAEMAALLAVQVGAYQSYENQGAAPNLPAIALGLKSFNPALNGWKDVLAWLGAASDPPLWMNNLSLSPFEADGPGSGPRPAAPIDLEQAASFLVLDGRRKLASGTIEDPRFVRGVLSIEDWLKTVAADRQAVVGSAQNAGQNNIIRNDEAVSSSLTASFVNSASIIKLDDVIQGTRSRKAAV